MAETKRSTPAGVGKITGEARISGAASGPERRIIPLAGGTYTYVIDPVTAKNIHCKVDSPEFDELISAQAALSSTYAARLHRELTGLAHGDIPAALARLEGGGIFTIETV